MDQNKNIETIYLHVGMPKTATTSIQDALLYMKDKLIDNDLTFMDNNIVGLHNLFLTNPYKYKNYVLNGNTEKQVDDIVRSNLEQLKDDMLNCQTKRIIFSDETMISLSVEELNEAKSFMSEIAPNSIFKIIISVREIISYCTSVYQELCKRGRKNEFISQHQYLNIYQMFIGKYMNVFGKDNVIIYKFEDAVKFDKGPISYFLNVLDIDSIGMEAVEKTKTNISMSDKAVEVLDFINNNIPLFTTERDLFTITSNLSPLRRGPDTLSLLSVKGKKFQLKNNLKKMIYDKNASDINWLNETFQIRYDKMEIKDSEVECFFDEEFYNDIVRVYPTLTKILKKLVFDYLNQLDVSGDDGIIVERLINWINSRYQHILNDPNINITTKSDLEKLDYYHFNGRKKISILRNILQFLLIKIKKQSIFDEKFYMDTYYSLYEMKIYPSSKKYPILSKFTNLNFIRNQLNDPFVYFFFKGVYEGHNPNANLDMKEYILNREHIYNSGKNAFFNYFSNK